MKPEIKTFEFKLEDADENKGVIRGFASTFGNVDQGFDVVEKGAFKKTLQESKGLIPILADHDPSKQIGWNVRAEENDKGLFVEGRISLETEIARGKYALAKQALELGAKMGLSIGYATIKATSDKERPTVRILKELKLYEYSLVTFPMNTAAMVTAAKSWAEGSQLDFVDNIFKAAKERGMDQFQLLKALQNADFEAAIKKQDVDMDPTGVSPEELKLIETLNKLTKEIQNGK